MSRPKLTSGVKGLDAILDGGFPAACPTLIKGGPGCGKTVLSLSFVHAQLAAGKAAVVVTCDEAPQRLLQYMDEFGMAGSRHHRSGKLQILDFRPNLAEQVVGEYALTPILMRIDNAIQKTRAAVLVVDSLQSLRLGFQGDRPRHEVLDLFDKIRETGVAAVVTMSSTVGRGQVDLLEEYAADCVIHLDQRVENNLMTRYLRVVKFRGSAHGSNSYPFSLTSTGVSLLPVTATRLERKLQRARFSTGVARIDDMLGGKGYIKGTSLMVSGRAGSGKTILAATMLEHLLSRGKKGLYVSFEECADELCRNLSSVGIDFARHLASGHLTVHAERAVQMGLEDHLIAIIRMVEKHKPALMVVDPISALMDLGSTRQVKMLLVRFISHIKALGVTLVLSELLLDDSADVSDLAISSMVDTWFRLRQVESNGELNRLINVVKARGCATSNQVKEFTITDHGLVIEDPYIGQGELVVGSAKAARMAQDQEQRERRGFDLVEAENELAALQAAHESRHGALEAEFAGKRARLRRKIEELGRQAEQVTAQRESMKKQRG